MCGMKAAIVDLNNFALYPTPAVGILAASLRQRGIDVTVHSPLGHDVPAKTRERTENYLDHLARRLHLSTDPLLRPIRDTARAIRHASVNRPHPKINDMMEKILAAAPDVLLLSAYLNHYPTVVEICRKTATVNVPTIVGGAAFNFESTCEFWRKIPGITAIVGAEVDLIISDIACAAADGKSLLSFPGVVLPNGEKSERSTPLPRLDEIPIPDFSDYPWHRCANPVVPIMTGRGCGWARCLFCNDIAITSGRTFRTRTIESVLHEMKVQSRRYGTNKFIFLDLKINSNVRLWSDLIEQIQTEIPGAEWIATVHADNRTINGLSKPMLAKAFSAGLRRLSFGLESGSQALLDKMRKGSSVEGNSVFIRNAHSAGISVRCTMFKGFPGETCVDLEKTALFLEEHEEFIDRIRFNEFSVLEGSKVLSRLRENPKSYSQIRLLRFDARNAAASWAPTARTDQKYRRSLQRVLQAVYRINKRKIRHAAKAFDGMM